MKKQYVSPALELLLLKTADFLNTSGDGAATGDDTFEGPYGESFT